MEVEEAAERAAEVVTEAAMEAEEDVYGVYDCAVCDCAVCDYVACEGGGCEVCDCAVCADGGYVEEEMEGHMEPLFCSPHLLVHCFRTRPIHHNNVHHSRSTPS